MSHSPAPPAPDAVVRAYFAAFDADRFEDAVRCLDLASMARFRQEEIERAEAAAVPAAPPPPGPSFTIGSFPADLYEKHRHAVPPPPYVLAWEFAGVETLDQLRALEPDETVLRYLQARTPAYRQQLAPRDGWSTSCIDSGFPEHREVLGAVVENEELAHVVWRETLTVRGEGDLRSLQVLTVRRTGAAWRIGFPMQPPGIRTVSCEHVGISWGADADGAA
jgi:hypothetical protein